MVAWIALFVLCCLGDVGIIHAAVKLSDFVTKCSLTDPSLEKCMTTQGKALLPHIVAGIREWGMPSMDPLEIPFVSLNVEAGGLSLNATDIDIDGWKDMHITSIRMNPKNYETNLKLQLPKANLKGNYAMAGKIILLPIQGAGVANCIFHDVDLSMKLIFETKTREGKTYLNMSEISTKTALKHITFNFDNLFGNKQLSDSMNAILTEHSLEVFEDFKGSLSELLGNVIQGILNRMFSKVPLDQLFKD